jgi:hypothetical protein
MRAAAARPRASVETKQRAARARSLATTFTQVNAWEPEFNPFAAVHAELSAAQPWRNPPLLCQCLQSPSALRGLWASSAWLYDSSFDAPSLLGYQPRVAEELSSSLPSSWLCSAGVPLLRPLRLWRLSLRQSPSLHARYTGRASPASPVTSRVPFSSEVLPDYFTSERRRRCFSSGEPAEAVLDFDSISRISAEDVASFRRSDGSSSWPAPRRPLPPLSGTRLYLRPLAPSVLIGKAWRHERPDSQQPGERLCHVLLVRDDTQRK